MRSSRTQPASRRSTEPVSAARISAVVGVLCSRYQLDRHEVRVRQMAGVNGGLGNAIPLPIPYRRRYIVRFHTCIRDADELALRGLFAHELMHVHQYSQASYTDLLRFMARYATFSITAHTRNPRGYDWVRQFEHLTDLMAVKLGEGASIAAWKRFKSAATERGSIADSWDHLYLRAEEIDAVTADPAHLEEKIRGSVRALGAVDEWQPLSPRVR